MHNEIRKLIRIRKRLHKKAKRSNTETAWSKFRKMRNKIVKLIRSSKATEENRISEALKANTNNIKSWWKLSKQALNIDRTTESIPQLIHNNQQIENDQEKADVLNTYFIAQSQLRDANTNLPEIQQPPYEKLHTIDITSSDIRDILRALNVSKASGPDLISPRLLKEGADQLCEPLSQFFSRLIHSGRFPQAWKLANVTPVFKKGDKQLPNNYRPISLLSGLGKTMERLVHKHVYNYCIQNNILTASQSGFIQGDSTTYQLLQLYDTFCEAVDNGKEVRVVFLDITKAFDRVWHKGLLHKLVAIGISDNLLNWFASYLSSRKQRVVINGKTSSYQTVPAGVPQGSILGPLLFLIYINDIVLELNCGIRLFADDTSLYIIVENPQAAANLINSSLSTVHVWSRQWLVDFNAAKTETMVASRKRNKPNHPDLIMNNIILQEVEHHKHLGITFSADLTWHNHIIEVTTKGWQRINLLRAFKFKLDRKSLERMYISFIRPVLEYSGVVWGNCTHQDKKLLESIQIEAMRIVTGATKLCSIEKLYDDTGWETLEARREKQKLIIFYKMINGLAPTYLNQLVPGLVQDQSQYSLRNANNMSFIHANSALYYNSFLPSVTRAWNNLPTEIRNSTSVTQFKYRLAEHINKPPSWFDFGSRNAQIYHTRLRLECSSLRHHLYRKNLIDSPLCLCGRSETSKHYFFECPNHHLTRIRLLSDILHLPLKTLLFGDSNFSKEENERIFDAVHKYIIQSKRFDIN
ncbi:MAG: reverse transcriptase family protein [Candidatus Thiodiazotropha endolucinida]|nr:reverse transcriptase family protein [Candidatus Thiodiazotropha taylori]MCW4346054.1 reverse transcriptase family protein [Candidatus Thiodiazotropha endolucinida]